MIIAVSGIDTGIGKTEATGLLARAVMDAGKNVITQKMVQTGCCGIAEDILRHREMMGCGVLEIDRQGLTCPYVFPMPASPHLAARQEGVKVDPAVIERSTSELQQRYDVVVMEGAGGLMVPLDGDLLLVDYLALHHYPLVLVTSSRLGSINHTLLSLEACRRRNLPIAAVLYNRFAEEDAVIAADTRLFLEKYLRSTSPGTPVIELPDTRSRVTGETARQLARAVISILP
ncbi:MAG TPA: ATP-dependent dethiobiotin synthetase BioD [Prosthecochloris aestuarii]|uniref:ATP-dependent dethiobiotin synthetase BioD n=1 Tax=Prosthecochloris aestuarii TaxID=1102 RepID=A0A831SSD1_PROAE|nr:ATP-dependent dethiobiotin synthetase BioD [Prosthecochloris aestuarii]